VSVPFWLVVAILVAAVLGTLGAGLVALVFATRARNAERRVAELKALEARAMEAAYATAPGQLFDIAAGLRRQIATRILTGEDPPG
jgi:hypothetical protein